MPSLELFRPRLCRSELFFHNDKVILKAGMKQAVLPVQALHFLIYFNGQYNLKEIIERNHASQKTVHFGMLLRSLIRLKEKGLLENGDVLDGKIRDNEGLDWFVDFPKPIYSFNIKPLTGLFSSSVLFNFLSIGIILLSLFAASQFTIYEAFTGFLMVHGSYWKGGLSLLFCLSFFMSLKYLIQLLLQLFLLGRAYNIRTIFNGICFYFYVGSDSLLLSPSRLLAGFYFLCGISCYFLFSYIIQMLPFDIWILGQTHLAVLILFVSNLNPLGRSDMSQLFKILYDDDTLNKVSHLYQDYSMVSTYGNHEQWSFRCLHNSHSLGFYLVDFVGNQWN